jgi:hypothetical protein
MRLDESVYERRKSLARRVGEVDEVRVIIGVEFNIHVDRPGLRIGPVHDRVFEPLELRRGFSPIIALTTRPELRAILTSRMV